jgi:hypothetical protein
MPSPASTAGRPQPVGASAPAGAPSRGGALGSARRDAAVLIFLALACRRIIGPCRPVGREAKLAARRRWALNKTHGSGSPALAHYQASHSRRVLSRRDHGRSRRLIACSASTSLLRAVLRLFYLLRIANCCLAENCRGEYSICVFHHSFHCRRCCCLAPVQSRNVAPSVKQGLPVRKALPA